MNQYEPYKALFEKESQELQIVTAIENKYGKGLYNNTWYPLVFNGKLINFKIYKNKSFVLLGKDIFGFDSNGGIKHKSSISDSDSKSIVALIIMLSQAYLENKPASSKQIIKFLNFFPFSKEIFNDVLLPKVGHIALKKPNGAAKKTLADIEKNLSKD